MNRRRDNRNTKSLSYQTLEPKNLLAGIPIVSEFLASNTGGLVDEDGNTSDWIEIYNAGDAAVNLAGYSLTDDPSDPTKWTFPATNLLVGQYTVVFAGTDTTIGQGSQLFTGFSLKASGEYVGFYDPAGNVLSEFGAGGVDYPQQYPNVSYGVGNNVNFDQVGYFASPTPYSFNSGAVAGVVGEVGVNQPAGFHDAPFQVSLSSQTAGANIYYTLDGSTPSATNGSVYTSPITISSTTNLRTVATKSAYLSVPDRTTSYIFIDDVLTQSLDGSAPPGWPSNWGNTQLVDYGLDQTVISAEGTQTIKDALVSIPTWSVTTDLENLFDPTTGIYSNAEERGIDWERPASVELLNPDGTEGFQVNAGLRIKGAFSRRPENPKHSFKIYLRSEYGDSELNYPIHGNEGVDTFKKLDLRTAQNWSWSFNGSNTTTFVEDELARENQKDLGQPYTRSTWFHMYLNGQYWGIYQTQERHDDNFGASYFGGQPEDYDVIKGKYVATAVDGNLEAYHRLFDQAAALDLDGSTPNFVNQDAYMKAQGLNPDGTRNLNYEVLLDVDNLISYMLIEIQGGNRDGPISMYSTPTNSGLNNFFAMRNRNSDMGFQFFAHDSEHMFRDVNENRLGPFNDANFDNASFFNAHTLHQKLMANAEYRLEFGDAVQKHFFNGGTLSSQAQIDKMYELAQEIDTAVYAESARWGDAKQNNPRLRQDWLNAMANLRDNYFPARNDVVLDQFRNAIIQNRDGNGNYTINQSAPLFPSVDAPDYLINNSLQSGGLINAGSQLSLSSDQSSIYYTLDGSDPRLPGGGISSSASVFNSTTSNTTVVAANSNWRFHDQGSDLGTAWRSPSYNDNSWSSGNAELGYGDGGEATTVSYGNNANFKHVTTYFRKTFNVAAGNYTDVTLRMRRDDGAVAYLNGTEIARSNMPAATNFDTFATTYASGDGNTWYTFQVPANLLTAGSNTLAIEVHQSSRTSSDVSFNAELTVAEASGGSAPITLNDSTIVRSRTLAADGTWSAVHDASYFLDAASQSDVRISEIYYNPYDSTPAEVAAGFSDADKFEFIEVVNSHPTGTVNLQGMQLFNGVAFTFGDINLDPGERVVVVENLDAFSARYGSSVNVAGQWTGGLSNNGETVALIDSAANEVMSVGYDDTNPWSVAADGEGASLILLDPFTTPQNELGKYYSWGNSFTVGGTPGTADVTPSGIVINEIVSHTDAPNLDSIELYNPTQSPFNIGGWYLSDSGSNALKYQIPAGTILGPGLYMVFDESDFNPTPATPAANHFALNSSSGDQVYLSQASGGTFLGFDAVVDFGASFNGQSLSRIPNGTGQLTPATSVTLGAANSTAQTGPLVISEVNYHPAAPSAAALAGYPNLDDNDLEFIEISNTTSQAVSLTNWRIRGESDFDFAPGGSLAAGESVVVVSFDPSLAANAGLVSAFQSHYGISNVNLVGPFSGSLSNSSGRITLQQPDVANPITGSIPNVMIDEVVYDDLFPWANADGSGQSLHRDDLNANANLASSWSAAAPTPGLFENDFLLGDANQNGEVNFADISAFISLLADGAYLDQADANQDGVLNFADISHFITLLQNGGQQS